MCLRIIICFLQLGIVQFFFLIFNEGVPFEWAILLNDIVALATLVYIADILRRNMRRFEENMFCMKVKGCG